MLTEPLITSFTIRLTRDRRSGNGRKPEWRVVVRQVQSGEETHFARLEDAFAHIRRSLEALEEPAAGGESSS